MAREPGAARTRPLSRPPTIRIVSVSAAAGVARRRPWAAPRQAFQRVWARRLQACRRTGRAPARAAAPRGAPSRDDDGPAAPPFPRRGGRARRAPPRASGGAEDSNRRGGRPQRAADAAPAAPRRPWPAARGARGPSTASERHTAWRNRPRRGVAAGQARVSPPSARGGREVRGPRSSSLPCSVALRASPSARGGRGARGPRPPTASASQPSWARFGRRLRSGARDGAGSPPRPRPGLAGAIGPVATTRRPAAALRLVRRRLRDALDRDGPALPVLGRAARDPLARARGVRRDLRPQRRDVLALAFGRRGRRGVRRPRARAPSRSRSNAACAPCRRLRAARGRSSGGGSAGGGAWSRPARRNRRRPPWRASRRADRAGRGCAPRRPRPRPDRRARTARTTRGSAGSPKAEVLEHALDLPVLALAQAHGDPGVRALLAVELRLDARRSRSRRGDPVAQARARA